MCSSWRTYENKQGLRSAQFFYALLQLYLVWFCLESTIEKTTTNRLQVHYSRFCNRNICELPTLSIKRILPSVVLFHLRIPGVFFAGMYNFSSFGRWQAFGLLVTSIIYYICYQGVVEAARMGVPGGVYFDVLVVCLTGQAVSTVSSFGWYIYLLVRLNFFFYFQSQHYISTGYTIFSYSLQ